MLKLIWLWGRVLKIIDDLNTSHVKVNHFHNLILYMAGTDLNTSHVKVNLKMTEKVAFVSTFKYISC